MKEEHVEIFCSLLRGINEKKLSAIHKCVQLIKQENLAGVADDALFNLNRNVPVAYSLVMARYQPYSVLRWLVTENLINVNRPYDRSLHRDGSSGRMEPILAVYSFIAVDKETPFLGALRNNAYGYVKLLVELGADVFYHLPDSSIRRTCPVFMLTRPETFPLFKIIVKTRFDKLCCNRRTCEATKPLYDERWKRSWEDAEVYVERMTSIDAFARIARNTVAPCSTINDDILFVLYRFVVDASEHVLPLFLSMK